MLIYYLQFIESEEDQRLFEYVYENHKQQMQWVATDILHDRFWAEDAVHNAFIRIANNMSAIRGRGERDIKNYVLKAAKNAAYDLSDIERPHRKPPKELEPDIIEDSVLEGLYLKEKHKAVVDGIYKLPEPYNTVLHYRFVLELDNKQIATVLQRKEEVVRQQICRGKKYLKELLEKEFEEHV